MLDQRLRVNNGPGGTSSCTRDRSSFSTPRPRHCKGNQTMLDKSGQTRQHAVRLPQATGPAAADTILYRLCFALLIMILSIIAVDCGRAAQPNLTFFGWSDQHVQTDGNGEHLLPAIDAMNRLPGTPFPDSIGGKVERPSFVFGCGDITEWPTHAAKNTFEQLVTKRLDFPVYNIMGNHDEGGKSPVDTIKRWIIQQHGSLSYTFQSGGVRFICLFSKYNEDLNNPAQPLTRESLDHLLQELDKVPKDTPSIVATHLCFDAITNRDALVNTLKDHNVIAVLGGHYHKAKVDRYHGLNFVQLPSPAPGSPSEFTVIRISGDRIVAVPYDYSQKAWDMNRQKVLDVQWRITP